MSELRLTRRETLLSSAALVTAAALPHDGGAQATPEAGSRAGDGGGPPPKEVLDITLDVNGQPRRLTVDAETSLLDALRERLGLTGSKKGCNLGQCGACGRNPLPIIVPCHRVLGSAGAIGGYSGGGGLETKRKLLALERGGGALI